jgi:hypothetical protein
LKCNGCGRKIDGYPLLLDFKHELHDNEYVMKRREEETKDKRFCSECVHLLQLKFFAETLEMSELNEEIDPAEFVRRSKPVKLRRMWKMPAWLRRGVGAVGGGEVIGKQIIGSAAFTLYMSWQGIRGTSPVSACFYDAAGNWYRIHSDYINIVSGTGMTYSTQ